MGAVLRSILLFLAVLLVLPALTSCQDGQQDTEYYLDYEARSEDPPRRPGTQGVRIKPPKRKPLVFELLHGSSLDLSSLVTKYPGSEVTAEFTVPCDGGRVQNVWVSHEEHKGFADFVKRIISTWRYSTTKCGKMKIIINLRGNGSVDVDKSQLHNNGERDAKWGDLYND